MYRINFGHEAFEEPVSEWGYDLIDVNPGIFLQIQLLHMKPNIVF